MPVIVFSGCKTGCATALGMSFIVLLCPKAVSPLSFPSRSFVMQKSKVLHHRTGSNYELCVLKGGLVQPRKPLLRVKYT